MATEEELKQQRSDSSKKAAETRRANKLAAQNNRRQNVGSGMWPLWLGLGLLAGLIIGGFLMLWHPWGPTCPVCVAKQNPITVVVNLPTSVPAAVVPTQAPLPPIVNPTPEPNVPAPVSCDTPSIRADVNDSTGGSEKGKYLIGEFGVRMTFTSRSLLVPNKAYNEVLTPAELKTVEDTWQYVVVCIPQGTFGRIFAGGYAQGLNRYENGVLLTLNPGQYEFQMRNGEVIIWYPDQLKYSDADLLRIFDQIRKGNFDIHSPLAFFATTVDLQTLVPTDLAKQDNVQVVPYPSTK